MEQPSKKSLHPLLGVAIFVAAGVVVYKTHQALTDIEIPRRTFPKDVREAMKAVHIEGHGPFCPACGDYADEKDLEIDHRVPYSKGGRTSLNNSRVVCRPCNRKKGSNHSFFDSLLGRGGREDEDV